MKRRMASTDRQLVKTQTSPFIIQHNMDGSFHLTSYNSFLGANLHVASCKA